MIYYGLESQESDLMSSSNSDVCICGHLLRAHFNPILGGKRRPCSHVRCPCLDFKQISS
jgi:hypothetical protein